MPGNILTYNCELSSGYCTLSVLSRCVVEELLPTTLGIIWSSVTVLLLPHFCPVVLSALLAMREWPFISCRSPVAESQLDCIPGSPYFAPSLTQKHLQHGSRCGIDHHLFSLLSASFVISCGPCLSILFLYTMGKRLVVKPISSRVFTPPLAVTNQDPHLFLVTTSKSKHSSQAQLALQIHPKEAQILFPQDGDNLVTRPVTHCTVRSSGTIARTTALTGCTGT